MLLESFIITEFTSLLAHPLSTNHPLRICKALVRKGYKEKTGLIQTKFHSLEIIFQHAEFG